MPFVNNIGDVVHAMADRFLGAANKNIGDAFLLVWKLDEKKVEILDDKSIRILDTEYAKIFADYAVLAFMKL